MVLLDDYQFVIVVVIVFVVFRIVLSFELIVFVLDEVLSLNRVLQDFMQFGYFDYVLYQQICEGVEVLDVKYGCSFDEVSECMMVSFLVLVKDNDLEWVDYVLVSNVMYEYLVGYMLFVVQGELSNLVYQCVVMLMELVVQILVEELL